MHYQKRCVVTAVMTAVLMVHLSASALKAVPSVLLDTAGGAPNSQGVLVGDDAWVFHRFEVTETTRLSTVGGVFRNFLNNDIEFFGAVIGLSGPSDFPDTFDLMTPAPLGTNLLSAGPTGSFGTTEVEGPLDVVLEPGWHALAFGTGAFGAPSLQGFGMGMPNHAVDLAPGQLPVSIDQDPNNQRFILQDLRARFIVTGEVVVVPEPMTTALGLMGIGALAGTLRRRVG